MLVNLRHGLHANIIYTLTPTYGAITTNKQGEQLIKDGYEDRICDYLNRNT